MAARHFLSLNDLSGKEIRTLVQRAGELKSAVSAGPLEPLPCKGRILVMVFEKSSTRTRVSFEAAMVHLGGHAIFLSPGDSQLGRGEPLSDMARVLSKMADCVMIRTFEHDKLVQFAGHSEIPVINGLTDSYHPCQLLADMQTFFEFRGDIRGKKVCWLGDGNNMCNSYINASRILEFNLSIACPSGYLPAPEVLSAAGDSVQITDDPHAAAKEADLVVTDVWASMGQEEEARQRRDVFRKYQVSDSIMAQAAADALFMHCLPAHRGEEVAASVIDGPRSVVWEEAGNRLYSQMALLEFLLQ